MTKRDVQIQTGMYALRLPTERLNRRIVVFEHGVVGGGGGEMCPVILHRCEWSRPEWVRVSFHRFLVENKQTYIHTRQANTCLSVRLTFAKEILSSCSLFFSIFLFFFVGFFSPFFSFFWGGGWEGRGVGSASYPWNLNSLQPNEVGYSTGKRLMFAVWGRTIAWNFRLFW